MTKTLDENLLTVGLVKFDLPRKVFLKFSYEFLVFWLLVIYLEPLGNWNRFATFFCDKITILVQNLGWCCILCRLNFVNMCIILQKHVLQSRLLARISIWKVAVQNVLFRACSNDQLLVRQHVKTKQFSLENGCPQDASREAHLAKSQVWSHQLLF